MTELGFHGAMLFGRTRDRNLDHPDNWPIFEAAAALRAPLYIHPQASVPGVRDALYGGLGDDLDAAFATFGLAKRIMFSSDFPYRFTPGGGARRFLERTDLFEADRHAIGHGNRERMVTQIRRT